MRPTAGRWVSGADFFDREGELRVLESHVRDRNHLLLTGQRRMGKTSIARELGRRLEGKGWIFLFADVEGSTCAEDAVATIAKQTYPIRSIASRLGSGVREWFGELPIFLKRMLHDDGDARRVDELLSWLLWDWWAARFRDHHVPLESRCPGPASMG